MCGSMWADQPTFVLTGDQDWAPPWALQRWLEAGRGVPMHLFVTNPDDVVAAPPPNLTLGIHPNFLPGSTHGDDPAAVIAHCLALVPGAWTFRSHAFAEATPWLDALVEAGLRADSNLCTDLQPGLTPLRHACGLVRLPVFLEDDVVLRSGRVPSVDELELFTPGLKILNFHPALVAINARSLEDYAGARGALYGGEPWVGHEGRGIADLLGELLEAVEARGHRFMSFETLAERALEAG